MPTPFLNLSCLSHADKPPWSYSSSSKACSGSSSNFSWPKNHTMKAIDWALASPAMVLQCRLLMKYNRKLPAVESCCKRRLGGSRWPSSFAASPDQTLGPSSRCHWIIGSSDGTTSIKPETKPRVPPVSCGGPMGPVKTYVENGPVEMQMTYALIYIET